MSPTVHDPGPVEAAQRAAAVGTPSAEPIFAAGGGQIRVGTAGWTDPTLTAAGVFYPQGMDSAEERLRYYAGVFPLVEVDSTYYALPVRRNAALWVERTPPHFVFDIKAHALMTGQPTETSRLPQSIREALPAELASKDRIYGEDLPAELYDQVWLLFMDALEPLQSAGKLGSILLQYPRWFYPSSRSRETLQEARRRLPDLRCAIEFRNGAWLNEQNADGTLSFLRDQDLPLVMVDGPQGLKSSIPPLAAVTSPQLAVVRFHGRRVETWEARGVGVAERFRYFYDREELKEWLPRVQEAASNAQDVHVVMNNCYANYGTTNAVEFVQMIRETLGMGEG